jgi:putative hydrolase of the HAD superfamily
LLPNTALRQTAQPQRGFGTAALLGCLSVPEVEEDRMPQAILFDLDETLVDRTQSIVLYAERFQRDFMDRLGPLSASGLAAVILAADGRGYRPRAELCGELVRTLPWQTPPEPSLLQTHWETWFPSLTVAREGLAETLTALQAQGMRLGIVTNGRVRGQHTKITQLGIRPYLSAIVISEAVQIEKPDPRIFVRALAEVGCQASQAWFVGDHPVNDILGAAAAGLRPIWLTGVHPWPTGYPAPQWQIGALIELVVLVQSERAYAPTECHPKTGA